MLEHILFNVDCLWLEIICVQNAIWKMFGKRKEKKKRKR